MKKLIRRSSGFTLVEIAVVLTIVGVLMGSGIYALTSALNDVRYRTTRDRMNNVAQALALYAQQNYFLPCPAIPPLANGTTTGNDPGTCYGAASARGIVPYAALGLTAEQVRDSYGNYLTYVVNPFLATNGVQTNATALTQVHDSCRVNAGIWITGTTNRNQRKALFCCMGRSTANDLVVRDAPGGNILSPFIARSTANVGAPNGAGVANAVNTNSQTPAFVLISHGRNSYGAYRDSAVAARFPAPGGINYRPNEVANDDDADNVYVSAQYSTNTATTGPGANTYFDDVVLWRTQDQLIGAFGRDSCARP